MSFLGNLFTKIATEVVTTGVKSAFASGSQPKQSSAPKFSRATPSSRLGVANVETTRSIGAGDSKFSVRTGDSGSAKLLADYHADAMEGVRPPTSGRPSRSLT